MAIVRKDKMLAGYNGNLESVILHDKEGKAIESTNGVLVFVEGLMEGQREVVKATLADIADIDKDVLLIHNSEVMYDERLYKLADFRIAEGKVARAYRLYDGDIFTLTADLYAETVAVGDKLVVKADGLLGKGTTEQVDSAKIVFEVFENSGHELDINMEAFAVKVHRK
ncbi:hypothetical protein PQE75_gp232 [Bacillus phage vB_BcoS-136]|uniref:Uncharacterized protein n=1 Tax=Bacillus phage vB_BcoS-136 TaxID=2419619 RepID=A0A3G3BVH1_9CAUD|nr:hypothetical protein PQE75_gp232 [Bacillus phage vB_BcoS-136]AYP68247.1 hypothetical protein vBBcoS136_00132 [Bacillus phage vB_BcoS-136]